MKNIELKDNICILYDEKNILIKRDNVEKLLCSETCSVPSINPNKDKLAYISPVEWEEISNLMIYDINKNILKEVKIDNIPEYHTIKKIEWLAENKLIMIVGFANGTVTVGGDIYTYDIYNKEYNNIYKSLDREEVKNFNLKKGSLEIEVVTFDDNYNGYTTRTEDMKLTYKEEIV